MLLIKNAHIKPMVGAEMENGCMLVDGGKIAAIAPEIAAPEGAEVIDAGGRLVTPGCVEAHCHVGLHGQCLRWEGADYNESTDPITPLVRAIDSFDTFDGMLKDGIRGGVTTVCAGPGSANVVGGTFVVTKLVGKRIDKKAIKVNAAHAHDKAETVNEIADLAYHVMVLMIEAGISLEDIHKELASRHVIDHKVKQEKMTK